MADSTSDSGSDSGAQYADDLYVEDLEDLYAGDARSRGEIERVDVLISGGTVFDGSGRPGRAANVGIIGDRIAFIGSTPEGLATDRTINAHGCVVAPGFVDVHTHADYTLESTPAAEACLRQGVTTVVTGNCGSSSFPAPASGVDFASYAQRLAATGPGVNVAALVGHGALRSAVIGAARRPATETEVARMRELLNIAAQQGAYGLSTGLIYAPGSFAEPSEVAALAEVARDHDLLYATHLRDEAEHLLDALDEALAVARSTGVRLQISHLKAMGPANHGRVHEALAAIEQVRAEGFDVACDVYPYTASSTLLTSRIPDWAMDGGPEALLERLADTETRARIAHDLRNGSGRVFLPDAIVLADLPQGPYSDRIGASLQEIADERDTDPAETLLDVLHKHQARVWIVNHAMSEDDVRTVLQYPDCAVGSDGWEQSTDCAGSPHPRHFGTFARIFARYCRDEHLLTLADAIRKMTALPAARLGLTDRGLLKPGRVADVAVFDPLSVADTATYAAPKSYAVGTRAVLVNGQIAVADGAPTGVRAGLVLRRGTLD